MVVGTVRVTRLPDVVEVNMKFDVNTQEETGASNEPNVEVDISGFLEVVREGLGRVRMEWRIRFGVQIVRV